MAVSAALSTALTAIGEIVGFNVIGLAVGELEKWLNSENTEFINQAKKLIQDIANKNEISYSKAIQILNNKGNDAIMMLQHAEPAIRKAGRKLQEAVKNKAIQIENQRIAGNQIVEKAQSAADKASSKGTSLIGKITGKVKDRYDKAKEDINSYLNEISEDYFNGKTEQETNK